MSGSDTMTRLEAFFVHIPISLERWRHDLWLGFIGSFIPLVFSVFVFFFNLSLLIFKASNI